MNNCRLANVATGLPPVFIIAVLRNLSLVVLCLSAVVYASQAENLSSVIRCDGNAVDLKSSLFENRHVLRIENHGGPCIIKDTLVVPSNIVIDGIDNPILALRSSYNTTLFKLQGVHNIVIRGITIDGGSNNQIFEGQAKPIIDIINASSNILEDIYIKDAPRDIRIRQGSNNNIVKNVKIISPGYYRNTIGEAITYNGLTLSDAYDNFVENFSSIGHAGWTIGIVGDSQRNKIINVNSTDSGIELIGLQYLASGNEIITPFISKNSYPRWAAHRRVKKGDRVISDAMMQIDGTLKSKRFVYIADADGVTGDLPPNCTPSHKSPHPATPLTKCFDGGVTWVSWRDDSSASDNCISITGSFNIIEGGVLEDCRGHGISLYGDHNTIQFVTIKNAGNAFTYNRVLYYGINIESAFGGFAQNNIVVFNNIIDTHNIGTTKADIHEHGMYQPWIEGLTPTNPFGAEVYVTSGGQLYTTLPSGRTTRLPAPTCTDGNCSDGGGVLWKHIRSAPPDSRPLNNDVRNNSSQRSRG
jgi:hypothetical protein